MHSDDNSGELSPAYTRADVDRLFDGTTTNLKESFLKYLTVAPADDENFYHARLVTALEKLTLHKKYPDVDIGISYNVGYSFEKFNNQPNWWWIEKLI